MPEKSRQGCGSRDGRLRRRAHGDQNQIVYLEDAVRDGEPITREVVVNLPRPPAPFPVP